MFKAKNNNKIDLSKCNKMSNFSHAANACVHALAGRKRAQPRAHSSEHV